MKLLKEQGLVNKEAYGSITLTDKGKAVSRKIYKRHHMISSFLESSLGLDPAEASDNACRMEHIVSEEMLKAIEKYMETGGQYGNDAD